MYMYSFKNLGGTKKRWEKVRSKRKQHSDDAHIISSGGVLEVEGPSILSTGTKQ